METPNEEILRFANWWVCSKFRPGWDKKRDEFVTCVKEFEKETGTIQVVIVDLKKCGNIDTLENIPYYTPGHYICCIYKKGLEYVAD
jgi:hypothetical protein